MPTVDVVDLKRKKVGSVDLPQEVFGCKLHTALVHEAVVMQRAGGKWLGQGRSRGSKNILDGHGLDRSAPPYGVMAGRYLGRSRGITPTACRKRSTVRRFKARSRPS
jgi:hypothetical protein